MSMNAAITARVCRPHRQCGPGAPQPGTASSPVAPAFVIRGTPSFSGPDGAPAATPGAGIAAATGELANAPDVIDLPYDAMTARRGADSVESTEQSLGGEDFSWYLERVPGAMARLGVRTPGERTVRDLHQGDFDADESAITVGVEMFTAAALLDAAQ